MIEQETCKEKAICRVDCLARSAALILRAMSSSIFDRQLALPWRWVPCSNLSAMFSAILPACRCAGLQQAGVPHKCLITVPGGRVSMPFEWNRIQLAMWAVIERLNSVK